MRYWTKQLSAVINRTASRSIIAGAENLVEKVNTTLPITLSSELCEGHLDANSEAANRFIEGIISKFILIANCLVALGYRP